MFQNFEDPAQPEQAAGRVARLRSLFDELGLDGFLVPHSDEFQGEYLPPSAERLRWLTGFSGSAGAALILADQAILFVDGRYTLQVRKQTDGRIFSYDNLIETPPRKWLASHAPDGLRLGFDPWLHTVLEVEKLRAAVEARGGALIAVAPNPVDAIWEDRPSAPLGAVTLHPVRYCGIPATEKLAGLASKLREAGASHYVLSDSTSIAWAFNLRGKDVPHTPLALGYAVLAADGDPVLYMDPRKFDPEVLRDLPCKFAPIEDFPAALARLSASGARVGMDPDHASEALRGLLGNAALFLPDPVTLPRAVKNQTEIEGARNAHIRDGVAVTRFLNWLDTQAPGSVDEIAAARELENFRHAAGAEGQMPLEDISFDTISGAGPNGAIIHYRVTEATNRVLGPGELYLVDSGGQYRDGTTDITRTVAIGEPAGERRRYYTLVLKGLIALSTLRFPEGTRGSDIDAIARMALWKAGLDYPHGTGHGIGSYLSVHEGPQRISRAGTQKLIPNMILSNEPGYYREGEFGIRLENLIRVTPAEAIEGGDLPMLGFETLTLAPFDSRLVDRDLLTSEERDWLGAYHARIEREIGPRLDASGQAWLARQCAPFKA